jgi:hypothetical protein
MAKQKQVVPERDGKTSSWISADGRGFMNEKSN